MSEEQQTHDLVASTFGFATRHVQTNAYTSDGHIHGTIGDEPMLEPDYH
jgi:hypothetical protein